MAGDLDAPMRPDWQSSWDEYEITVILDAFGGICQFPRREHIFGAGWDAAMKAAYAEACRVVDRDEDNLENVIDGILGALATMAGRE